MQIRLYAEMDGAPEGLCDCFLPAAKTPQPDTFDVKVVTMVLTQVLQEAAPGRRRSSELAFNRAIVAKRQTARQRKRNPASDCLAPEAPIVIF